MEEVALVAASNAVEYTSQTNHTSKNANGNIITLTLKNNHLIVETEERAVSIIKTTCSRARSCSQQPCLVQPVWNLAALCNGARKIIKHFLKWDKESSNTFYEFYSELGWLVPSRSRKRLSTVRSRAILGTLK